MEWRISVQHGTTWRGGAGRGVAGRGGARVSTPGIMSMLNTLLPKRERGLPRFDFCEACGGGGGNEQPPLPSLRLVGR